MTIKDSNINKVRSTLKHRHKENKQVFQNELFGGVQIIAETPATLWKVSNIEAATET